MATRFNDFNSNGEERLLLGKECLSDKPIALSFPSPLRRPLALRQFEELQHAKEILAKEDVPETDAEFFDFEMPTYEDYSDNLSYFEQMSAQLEAFALRKREEQATASNSENQASQDPPAPSETGQAGSGEE